MSIYFKLYEIDGNTLRYVFPLIQETNIPQTVKKFTEVKGMRGNGSIIINGSDDSWDLIVRGILRGDNYEEITTAIDALETAVVFAEPYVIELDKLEGGASVYSYNVKRVSPIAYPPSRRNAYKWQDFIVTFKANSW